MQHYEFEVAAMPNNAQKRRIKQRLAAIRAFFVHLVVFVGVIAILAIVDIATGAPYWAHWVFLGWGLGVLAHAALLYGKVPQSLRRWESRKLRELIEAERLKDT